MTCSDRQPDSDGPFRRLGGWYLGREGNHHRRQMTQVVVSYCRCLIMLQSGGTPELIPGMAEGIDLPCTWC
jgi:hypothetical protein